MKRNKQLHGFTIIELLVVISVISLLSSIALTSVTQIRIGAKNTKREGDLKALQTALEFYYDDHNSYPPNASYLSRVPNYFLGHWDTLATMLQPYLATLPQAPINTQYSPSQLIAQSYFVGTGSFIVNDCTLYHKKMVSTGGYYMFVINENSAIDAASQNDGGLDPTQYEVFGGAFTIQAC